ncbi:hypothetical protein [Jannaschia seohaensis]|uniref:AAA+ family ATPase n=1 Tax=Jannaschia seohaensis TaxID=475081 RepID=A0A2Y9A896_9RHOB|nr:hypothetical protein [Jannaschia seohaensis]PWJ22501.1 hypothetical protein BCF38_101915 [Jannaschia seohaensis]SSA38779.1 hypothetical protein SAMN05421539_101915 [Jannaschia seohaensis]
MRLLLLLPFLCLPAAAQEGEGRSAMEQGLRLFMDGLMQEMEPTFRDLEDLARDAGPLLERWSDKLSGIDLTLYHAPEVLENGDILIRRKREEEVEELGPPPEGAIDL